MSVDSGQSSRLLTTSGYPASLPRNAALRSRLEGHIAMPSQPCLAGWLSGAGRHRASGGGYRWVRGRRWQNQLRHRGVELGRLVDEGLVAGVFKPDDLLRGCGQGVDIGHAGPGRDPVIVAAEEEEDRHRQRGHELEEIQAGRFGPHRAEREPKPARGVGQIEDGGFRGGHSWCWRRASAATRRCRPRTVTGGAQGV